MDLGCQKGDLGGVHLRCDITSHRCRGSHLQIGVIALWAHMANYSAESLRNPRGRITGAEKGCFQAGQIWGQERVPK